jgi:hypothetical protein
MPILMVIFTGKMMIKLIFPWGKGWFFHGENSWVPSLPKPHEQSQLKKTKAWQWDESTTQVKHEC